jgi:hypothetical protein
MSSLTIPSSTSRRPRRDMPQLEPKYNLRATIPSNSYLSRQLNPKPRHITSHSSQLQVSEYLVQWKGYDTSQMSWEARASLLADVPTVLRAYEKSPTTAQARASAPKRAPTMMTSPTSRRRSARLAAS